MVCQDQYRIITFDEDAVTSLTPYAVVGQPSPILGQYPADLSIPTPSDTLLRWHFEQAVISNIRGAGEVKDDDFDEDLLQGEVDLSRKSWATEGKEVVERHFHNRLARLAVC